MKTTIYAKQNGELYIWLHKIHVKVSTMHEKLPHAFSFPKTLQIQNFLYIFLVQSNSWMYLIWWVIISDLYASWNYGAQRCRYATKKIKGGIFSPKTILLERKTISKRLRYSSSYLKREQITPFDTMNTSISEFHHLKLIFTNIGHQTDVHLR